MTERRWLACIDPTPMLDYLVENDLISDRKHRLYDCACVRRLWHLLRDERGRRAVEIAERFADGFADLEQLREAQANALAAADAQATLYLPGVPDSYTVLSATAGVAWEYRGGADPLRHAAEASSWEGLAENGPSERRLAKARYPEVRSIQSVILRDIIGNPFRPVTADPRWLTSTAVALAEVIYAERAFDRLPILADALEEAGCDSPDILTHLRGDGPHVRGCWAVDLVLGKE